MRRGRLKCDRFQLARSPKHPLHLWLRSQPSPASFTEGTQTRLTPPPPPPPPSQTQQASDPHVSSQETNEQERSGSLRSVQDVPCPVLPTARQRGAVTGAAGLSVRRTP
ncbi:hypothetical protein AAFF_G00186320 [Aldrovandia affinis]|uniref:Uncharacterized protein n=1 Tax=Aldrovandia affinis TaxID=143900 RepID=A0AAD7SXQ8_9TELE|nr:hypothetical protein AAFF_G00186320 [Aldrovandia affinis]